jgi:phytoene dehydrogenase-like protein
VSVVVIGGGVNERVAAHLLARAGKQVVLLDDGRTDGDGWVAPAITSALGISVQQRLADPWASGHGLELWRDITRSVEAIRRLSAHDAERWPSFCERMAFLARFLERLYLAPPADPTSFGMAFGVRRLGRQGMEDLMRLVPMSLAELLDDWFECDALKALLAAGPLRHALQGPRSGGTAFCLLHDHVGSPAGVFRAGSSNLHAVLTALSGVEVRRAAAAKISSGGVSLASGETIPASIVVSGLHPVRTLLELADPGGLDPELARAVGHIRSRRFAVPRDARGLDELERAYDDAKHRRAVVNEGVAELTLDQALWMRPLPELARYRTPIEGLWLCGESMHPGPGIAGAAGYNCAREILK